MYKPLTLFVVVSLTLAACSSNTTNPSSTVTVVQPKAGSTFTHEEYDIDTTTGTPIPASKATYTYTFTRVGISLYDETNVSELTNADDPTDSPIYLNYESNGDVSLFTPISETSGKWLLLPISSKTTTTITVMDTTIDFLGVSMQMKSTMTTSYVGTENITVKGQSISAVKIKQATKFFVTIGGTTDESSTEATFSFAPSLGFLAKAETPVTTDPTSGSKYQGSLSTLIDYNLIR